MGSKLTQAEIHLGFICCGEYEAIHKDFLKVEINLFYIYIKESRWSRLLIFCVKEVFSMLDRTEYENYWYAFQKKLDKLLDERNMSYRELSIKLGKSPGYIHDILSRRIDPSTISLFAMAAYFNCSIWDFLNITK